MLMCITGSTFCVLMYTGLIRILLANKEDISECMTLNPKLLHSNLGGICISRSVASPNPKSFYAHVKITQGEIPHIDTMLRSTWTLTLLTEVKGVQREGSTLSYTPDELQILVIVVVMLGQEADSVEPAGVVG